MKKTTAKRALGTLLLAALPVLLAGCYDDDDPPDCSLGNQKAWLGAYMDDWYLWTRLSPKPVPGPYADPVDYFEALLYTGTDPSAPADIWSFSQRTADFERYYGDGQALGFGISVAGDEVAGGTNLPLYVRYVEPRSDAAARGVVRGDEVISVNGRLASDMVAASDFSAFSASGGGQTLQLVLRNGGVDRTVVVTAMTFALTPVPTAAVVTTPLGRKMGYVLVKDMLAQAGAPLETAFAQFKAAAVDDVVLDLRYNAGGYVSIGRLLASYVAGTNGSGHVYSSLLYNDKVSYYANRVYGFGDLTSAASLGRVFVLTGHRTCSASEQVINGLRGIGVDVVVVGDTTCGKPVGFSAAEACGTTYAAMNFETVNEAYEGRYYDGFAPTCAVAEDFTSTLGATTEPLLAAARDLADGGACATSSAARSHPLRATARLRSVEPAERTGMLAR